jgi:hypothetical protein
MSCLPELKEFIYYHRKPFTSSQLVAELGLCYETTRKQLKALLADKYIKQIGIDKGKKVYIFNKNQNSGSIYKVNQKHYTIESIQEAYRRQIQRQREDLDLL